VPTVDIILRHPLDVDAAMARALLQNVQGIAVRLASVDDMLALKRNTGRRQDEDDVAHLLRIRGDAL
jgi:predicted nucleotidyltransferase